ncbi:MAG: DUF1571 domain-containing protein [Planctomycetaceae bacterium]|nr:DUF1571 domain-containing protein [Planctomycetaceae bacterium]
MIELPTLTRLRLPGHSRCLSSIQMGFLLSFAIGICRSPLALAQESQKEHPLIPAIKLTQQSQAVLNQVQDYEATLIKRERVKGQLLAQRIFMKLRPRPFSVYMKFEEPHAGREVLYVHGKNNNQLAVHEASGLTAIVGTVNLDPASPTAMAENRHPITHVGMHNMLAMLLEQWELESKYGEIDVQYYPNAKLGNAECEVIEVTHPRPRKQFNYHKTRLYLEKQSRLPIRIENYDFPRTEGERPPLAEEYTYLNVKANIGLTDADFDQGNPKYNF